MPANPVLNDQRFQSAAGIDVADTHQRGLGGAPGDPPAGPLPAPGADRGPIAPGRTMTIGGTLTATGVLFALILTSGAFGWSQVTQTTQFVNTVTNEVVSGPGTNVVEQNSTSLPGWLFVAVIVGLGLAFLTIFKPKLARVTAPLYALAYGAALGAISAVYNLSYDGIVVQAILATLGVFFVMLFLYATRIIKVTPRFAMMVIAATGGIFLMYLVGFVASFFGADIQFWNEPSVLGIGISVVIVIVAALNLALDFDFIERASAAQAPKYMEWYGAFGVTVTIVWLYLEMLRLLSLLRR